MAGLLLASAAGVLGLISDPLHAASLWPLVSFHLTFLVLIALAFPAPRSHAFTALAAVLTLGYWPKFLIRLGTTSPYLEPVGTFGGSSGEWDRALTIVATGGLGVIAVRVMHLLLPRRAAAGVAVTPAIYSRYRYACWIVTLVGMAAAYAWNTHAAVYVTGVNPRIVLPFKLNVILAWCYIMAFPLWISLLLGWELNRRQTSRLSWALLCAPIVEAIVSAGSLLSRATYLLRMAPYFLALTRAHVARRPLQLPRPRILTASAVTAGFALSVAAVMMLRAVTYLGSPPEAVVATTESPRQPTVTAPGPAGVRPQARPRPSAPAAPVTPPKPKSALELRPLRYMVHEVGTLFVDRWTGMEGVLAVSGSTRNPEAFHAVLTEDPSLGTASIYQRLAMARYGEMSRFTFLTLAGIVAVFAIGGSPWLLIGGMAAITVLLMLAESCTRWITRNEMACSVVAVTSAFVTAQVTYPRLFAVFLLELWGTLALLAVASACWHVLGVRRKRDQPPMMTREREPGRTA